ncbi:MAG: hypothetical protein ACRC78_22305 [Planktothrix sp.]
MNCPYQNLFRIAIALFLHSFIGSDFPHYPVTERSRSITHYPFPITHYLFLYVTIGGVKP